MTTPLVELSKVIRVHYGAALKEADRVQSGSHEVFGSSGIVGRHSESLFEYPSIVIGRKGSVGSVTHAPNGGWAIDTAFFVERLDPTRCDLRYLFYALSNARLAQHTITTSIPGLSRDDIYRTRILLPVIAAQRRIADILDKADAIRRKRQEAIALTEDLLRSAFLEMFGDPVTNPKGWPIQELNEFVSDDRPITYGILKPGPEIRDGVPYVRVVDIKNGRVNSDGVRHTTREIDYEYRRSRLRAGDLLMSIRGHVGRLAAVPPELDGANITQDTARIAPIGLDSHYLMNLIETEAIQFWMFKHVRGVAVRGINIGDLRRLPVPVPPAQLQTQFRKLAETTLRGRDTARRALAATQDLFSSLVGRAFSNLSTGEGKC